MNNILKVSFGKKQSITSKELYQYDYCVDYIYDSLILKPEEIIKKNKILKKWRDKFETSTFIMRNNFSYWW